MKKRSIFLTISLIVVAILAGCNNEVVYPAFPSTVVINQTGDFMKGQPFDASKFEVVVTYLGGSSKTFKNAALTVAIGEGGVQGGEEVSVNVGNDYYGEPVEYTANIANVYDVSYISATTKKAVFATTDTNPQDFVVTAYYGENKEVLPTSYYTVSVAEKADAATTVEGYAEATEVPGTATITLAFADTVKTTVDVTVSKAAEEDKIITGLKDVNYSGKIPAFNYDEAPELDLSKLIVTAYYNNTEETRALTATELAEANIYFVDFTTELPISKYDFITNKNVKIAVEYGDFGPVVTAGAPGFATPVITAEYVGAELNEKAALDLTAEDFYVTLNIEDKYSILNDFDIVLATASTTAPTETSFVEYTGTEVPATLYAYIGLDGVYSAAEEVGVKGYVEPSISAISAEFNAEAAGVKLPAKGLYKTAPATKDIEAGITVTGTKGTETVPVTGGDITYKYQLDGKDLAASNVDLTGVDELTVVVTYNDTFTTTVSVPLAEPVAEIIKLIPTYSLTSSTGLPMYGATVDWRIQGTASAEVYTFDYEGDFRIYKNDILTSSLPTDANDWVKENASYRVVIDKADGTTLASAAVDAPDSVVAYATVDEDSIEFKLNKTMLVGTTILYNESTNTAGIAPTDFVAVEGTWTPNGTAEAPKVTEIIVDYDEVEVADGTNNIKLKVSYVGDDGTEKEITIPYSFEGVGYITSEGFTLTVNEETLSNNGNLKSNWERWDVSDFVVSSYQKVGTVEDPQITAITVNNTPVDLSSDFELAPGATVTFEITYVGSAGSKTTSTLSLTVVGA